MIYGTQKGTSGNIFPIIRAGSKIQLQRIILGITLIKNVSIYKRLKLHPDKIYLLKLT
jgi:hypothetical protein